jgi:hypothetical protein
MIFFAPGHGLHGRLRQELLIRHQFGQVLEQGDDAKTIRKPRARENR